MSSTRRFIGRRSANTANENKSADIEDSLIKVSKRPAKAINQIPDDIVHDDELNQAIELLPPNYNFEIHKTVWNIRKNGSKKIALQMPEGLLMYACIISDILEQFCGVETLIMGDVTYGACCIDDFTARALGCDFLIHYAHSCLVPVDVTKIKVLYIFVTIDIDQTHLVNTLVKHFKPDDTLALVSTIQFNPVLHSIRDVLASKGLRSFAPQSMPLSKGEVLGCTSARLKKDDNTTAIIYIGDGRFHLESAMIHNPEVPAYKYDPYSRKFTVEEYDHQQMYDIRKQAIEQARKASNVGLILGALGRQGNPLTLEMLEKKYSEKNIKTTKVILSEIFPEKLAQFPEIDCWVQVACPRLSIDWGYAFPRPLLTPYEAMIALKEEEEWKDYYPMDYYSKEGYGRGKKPIRPVAA